MLHDVACNSNNPLKVNPFFENTLIWMAKTHGLLQQVHLKSSQSRAKVGQHNDQLWPVDQLEFISGML